MATGQERFTRYFPTDRTFVNTIENYPYPYVIGRLCWEFPCVTPSDWEAQSLQKPNNPNTVRDLKAALDCVVVKKGVFCLVFHPHGWIRNDQVVELIDHAVAKHGKKVKFLNFREAQERLDKNFLSGNSLREGAGGRTSRVRVFDVDNDGYLDVALGGRSKTLGSGTNKIWLPAEGKWKVNLFPVEFFRWDNILIENQVSVGVLDKNGFPTVYVANPHGEFWQFDGASWNKKSTIARVDADSLKRFEITEPFDPGFGPICTVRMRDLNNDGRCELLLEQKPPPFSKSGENKRAILGWSDDKQCWIALPFNLPSSSVRLLDLNGDGKLDIVFSNEKEYGVYLFTDMEKGWSKKIMAGKRGDRDALPMISRNGTNNGCWIHSGHLWWSNEDTVLLKDHVDRRSIKEMLGR